ncbi:hypothetical protein [Aneurinibacillus terranovensis]|uniref:hypothetical protein n=1 Tax=Aneurinibacillus terranovensis TaxID=278991 RepID=UPI0003FC7393|nr:hypothetical protein [Aneurinibacillus terranovensis]
MNPSVEVENGIVQKIMHDEIASDMDIFQVEISEWLRILPNQYKVFELIVDGIEREEAFFAKLNEVSEYLMER